MMRLGKAMLLTIGGVSCAVLCGLTLAARPADRIAVPRKTGNLSITSFRPAILEGRKIETPDPLLRDFESLRPFGFASVEDYITFDVIEPFKGRLNVEPYMANAVACRQMGIGYAVYPWLHFQPAWAEKEPGFTPYTNLEDGAKCRQPSGWAPATMKLSEHFYTVLGRSLRKQVSAVYVTDCSEYGELGYPNGYTQWLRPDPEAKKAWWCGDKHALDDFRASMLYRFGSFEKLNERWGTSFGNDSPITYPPIEWLKSNPDPLKLSSSQRRRVLDFIYWYQDAAAWRMQNFIRHAQTAFPDKPCEIKLGHGDESAIMGHSYSSACKILSGTPRLAIRSTHAATSYFHVKRVSTPARFFGFKDFLTEPPGDVKPERMAERIFTDACAGVTSYFDYPQNPKAASQVFAQTISLLDGRAALVDVALLFPEADHYLRIDRSYPSGLLECANAVRDVADFDVIDERLVDAGILGRYAVVVMVGDPILEEQTCAQLVAAIDTAGMRLVQIVPEKSADHAGRFVSVEGKECRAESSKTADQILRLAVPRFDDDKVINAVAEAYAAVLRKRGLNNRTIETLTARDGIWTAVFEHRILAYNTGDKELKVGGERLAGRSILEIKGSR